MGEFNLIDEPWIPCIDRQGLLVEIGIRDTLLRAHELSEICDDSPLVTVALHRMLLGILYRAHAGPRDFRQWRALYAHSAFREQEIVGYLSEFKDRFDLMSDSHPFYQMAGLETTRAVSVNRLATEHASGNNATLFDHCEDEVEAHWEPAQTARQLVACQSFALGFGKSGNAIIAGKSEVLPYSADAIALRGMTAWLQGSTLFDTLMINLPPTEDVSKPAWELDETNKYRDRLSGKERKAYSSFGMVDRLTWQSRLVRLIPGNGVFSEMYFTQGRSADKSPGDHMKVYRATKEEGVTAVPLSSGKAAWRDVHSILTIPEAGTNEHRPECFNLAARAYEAGATRTEENFVAHVVGLASAPNKAGKFLLWRHDRMPVPASLFGDDNLIGRLRALTANAEQAASVLNNRLRRMGKLYLAPEAETPDGRQPDKDEVTKLAESINPRPAFWARMEEHFFALLATLPGDWDSLEDDWKAEDQQLASIAWRRHVKDEARRALEESIRSLGMTARAIQAVARVRTDFTDDDLKPQAPFKAADKAKGGRRK